MGLTNIDPIAARQELNLSREMFYLALRDKFPNGAEGDRKCKAWVNGLELTRGEIRLEVELNANNNIFTFGVTPNQVRSNFLTERRLPLQDSICITDLQFYVWLPKITEDDGATFVADPDGTIGRLRTYGNTQDFTANSALALDTTFYSHSNFTFKRNNKVLVPYFGMQNFWYTPQTQQTDAPGANSPNDQIRGAKDATIVEAPNLVLIGSSNNQPQIELPANLFSVDTYTRVVMIGKGPYAQNSTVVQ